MFKRKAISIFYLALWVLASCSSDVPDQGSAGNIAAFDETGVQIASEEALSNHQSWPDIKDRKIVTFQTCLRDNGTQVSIVNANFAIRAEDRYTEAQTDVNGCIQWSEEFHYNYLAPERYIELRRSLVGLDQYRGEIELNFAVNLWKEGTLDLIDLKRDNQKDFDRRLLLQPNQLKNLKSSAELIINNIAFDFSNIDYSNKKFNSNLIVSFTPQMQRDTIANGKWPEALYRGAFAVKFYIVERDLETNTQIIIKESIGKGEIRNAKVDVLFENFHIDQSLRDNSEIFVYFVIEPLSIPYGLKNEQGYIQYESFNAFVSGNRGMNFVVPETAFNVEDIIARYRNNSRNQSHAQTNSDFGFSVVNLSLTRGHQFLRNANNIDLRAVQVSYRACLQNNLMRTKLSTSILFNMSLINHQGKTIADYKNIRPSIDGCLDGDATIEYNLNSNHSFDQYMLVVEGQSRPYKNIKDKYIFHLNPLSTTNFFHDSQRNGAPRLHEGAVNSKSPQLFVDTLSYSFLGNDDSSWNVDKYLRMSFVKRFNIRLTPQLRRDFTHESDDKLYNIIQNSKYRLEMYLIAPVGNKKVSDTNMDIGNLNDYKLISSDEVTVDSIAGRISAEIKLNINFEDLPSLMLKNLIVVKIDALNSNAIRPYVFTMPFNYETGNENFVQGRNQDLSPYSINERAELDYSKFKEVSNWAYQLKQKANHKQIQVASVDTLKLFREKRLKPALQKNNKTPVLKDISAHHKENAVLRAILAEFPNLSAETGARICELYYEKPIQEQHSSWFRGEYTKEKGGHAYNTCIKNPMAYFKVALTSHIQQVHNHQANPLRSGRAYRGATAKKVATDNKIIIIGDRHSLGQSAAKDQDIGKSHSFDRYVGTDIGVSKIVGVKAGMSVSWSNKVSESQGNMVYTSHDVGHSDAAYLWYNLTTLEIDASLKHCVLIEANEMPWTNHDEIVHLRDENGKLLYSRNPYGGPQPISGPKREIARPKEVHHLCSSALSRERIYETWYFVSNYARGRTAMFDGQVTNEQKYCQAIRGDYVFNMYREHLNQETSHQLYRVDLKYLREEWGIPFENQVRANAPLANFKNMSVYPDQNFPGLFINDLKYVKDRKSSDMNYRLSDSFKL